VDWNNLIEVPVLLVLDKDIGDGMIFEKESFFEALETAIENECFVYFAQDVNDDLDLMNAIGKIHGWCANKEGEVTLKVDFLDVPHSQATIQRLQKGWTTTSMKALGVVSENKVVKDLTILGFVESLKKEK
jgi:hypothetical protein